MARTKFPGLDKITLKQGAHDSPTKGVCLMEAVAWMRGIAHTDHPPCVCPVLGNMGRSLNDRLPDEMAELRPASVEAA
jgi:hypothetical protein